MYTCKDFDCLLGLAVDGLLDGPDRAALEQHLTGCAACRRKMADLTAIRAELAQPVETPDNLHTHIMAGIAAHEKQRRLRRLLKRVGSAAAAVVVCLMVAGGVHLVNSGSMKAADSVGFMAADAPMTSLYDSASSYKGGAAAESADLGPAEKPMAAPTPAPTAPAPMPEPAPAAPSAPVSNGAYPVLMAGEGIAFAGTYAFNLFTEGDPEEIKKILGVPEADEKAEGYVILLVPGDMDQVWGDLLKAGCTVTEDARNGSTGQGPALKYGLVSVKLK